MKLNVALLLASLVVLSACPAPFTPSTTPAVTDVGVPTGSGVVTNMIGASGGSVKSTDNKLELVIPAGALSANTAITITPISATGPGARLAWRLGPEGTTFAAPVTIKFTASDADLAGTELKALRIATQNASKQWESPETTISGNTVSVSTTHFSDWSLLTGWQITPGAATLHPSATQLLTVQYCHRNVNGDLVPIIATCQEDAEISSLLGVWQVNGIERGDSSVGTIVSVDTAGSYQAPSKPPSSNPVAVSVDFSVPSQGKVTLVANISVLGPGYSGSATWTNVTNNSHTEAGVQMLEWLFRRDEGTATSYTPKGNINFTYTHTASPVCDPVTSAAAISDGEMTVYSTSAIPMFQSRYVASFSATASVTTMCESSGGQKVSTSFDVPLIFQVGFCGNSNAEPWTNLDSLTGNMGCTGFSSMQSWTFSRQP